MKGLSGGRFRVALVVALLALVTIGGATALVGVRACGAPVDISGSGQGWLPDVLKNVKESDEFAYPAHVFVGDLLERFSCQPAAIGVQWLKAGAHARSAGQVERVAEGLVTAKGRAKSPENLTRVLCKMLGDHPARPQQLEALVRAGVSCDASP